MVFMDFHSFASNWLQSYFAWATFNRDGYASNVTWRQQQMYQEKNYYISWINIARPEIRDMMSVSITRMGNYVVVSTLLLGVVASMAYSVTMSLPCPNFVFYAFYLSVANCVLFLSMSIMHGVKGQNSAFGNTMKLLAYQIRPENPQKMDHNYMDQCQVFEQMGIKEFFRIPGSMPSIAFLPRGTCGGTTERSNSGLQDASPALNGTAGKAHDGVNRGALEDFNNVTYQTWYLTRFTDFMQLWHPHDIQSKYCMGLGTICLVQAFSYMAVGQLLTMGGHQDEFVALIISACSVWLGIAVVSQSFRVLNPTFRRCCLLLLSSGPALGNIAAVTSNLLAQQVLVPLSFLCHSAFWCMSYLLVRYGDWQELSTVDFADHGQGFWDREQKKLSRPRGARSCFGLRRPESQIEEEKKKAKEKDKANGKAGKSRSKSVLGSIEEGSTWPTEDPEFKEKAARRQQEVRGVLVQMVGCVSLFWLMLFGWSAGFYWINVSTGSLRASMAAPLAAVSADLKVLWPSALFRPSILSCSGGHIFMSDNFGIYEIFLSGLIAAKPVQCTGLDRSIIDLSSGCDDSGCRLFALVPGRGAATDVIDCQTGSSKPLLFDVAQAEGFSFVNSNTKQLVSSRQQELIYFQYSAAESAWVPQWSPGVLAFLSEQSGSSTLPGSNLTGISADFGVLQIFRSIEAKLPAVEVRDAATLRPIGQWRVPSAATPVLSGCALSAAEALILTSPLATSDPMSVPPRLVRLRLATT